MMTSCKSWLTALALIALMQTGGCRGSSQPTPPNIIDRAGQYILASGTMTLHVAVDPNGIVQYHMVDPNGRMVLQANCGSNRHRWFFHFDEVADRLWAHSGDSGLSVWQRAEGGQFEQHWLVSGDPLPAALPPIVQENLPSSLRRAFDVAD